MRMLSNLALRPLATSQAMPLNECIGLAWLPSKDETPGTNCTITGWGTLKSMGPTPDVLWMQCLAMSGNVWHLEMSQILQSYRYNHITNMIHMQVSNLTLQICIMAFYAFCLAVCSIKHCWSRYVRSYRGFGRSCSHLASRLSL